MAKALVAAGSVQLPTVSITARGLRTRRAGLSWASVDAAASAQAVLEASFVTRAVFGFATGRVSVSFVDRGGRLVDACVGGSFDNTRGRRRTGRGGATLGGRCATALAASSTVVFKAISPTGAAGDWATQW